MKKYLFVFVLALFINAPNASADCILGTPNCDPCAVGDSACVANAQQYTTTQQQAQQTTSQTQTSGFVALAPIPGLTQGVTANEAGLANFFNNLYKFLIGIAAVLAIIMIIWGGLEYSTQDSISKKSDGKERIYMAIFGLVLVLSPVLVFSIINPSILNLSLNLPPLDTKSGTSAARTATQSGAVTDASTECSVSGVKDLLQIAKCPSNATAGTFSGTCLAPNHLSAGKQKLESTGITYSEMICMGTKSYVFIDTGGTFTSAVNRLQPLVSTTNNPNNASDAMNFASICRNANIGRETCVSNNTGSVLATKVPCGFTTRLDCYEEVLSCDDVLISAKCSANPSWSPYPIQ